MASSKPGVENSLTPLLVANQTLPINSIEISAQSLFPLRVALPPVPVPAVNPLPRTPVQQQPPHPTISEPWVLLPASVLPLSSQVNFSAATPTLLPRGLAPEAVFSHQFQLNQTGLPLVMNSCMLQADPSLKTQPLNQQILLLPVDPVRGNLPPCLNVTQDVKETMLCKQDQKKEQSVLAEQGGKSRETEQTSISRINTGALAAAEQTDQQEVVTTQACIKLESLVSTSEVPADRSDLKANIASQTSALACDTTTCLPSGGSSPGRPGLGSSHPRTVSAASSDASSVPEPVTIMSDCISTTCREAPTPSTNASLAPAANASLAPATNVSVTPANDAHSDLSHLNIAQIISSLPPGWQLVGITDMDKIAPGFTGLSKMTPVVEQSPMTGSLLSPLTPNSSAVQPAIFSQEVNSLGKKGEDTTTIAMPRQVPTILDPLSPPSVLKTLANQGLEPQFSNTLGIPVKTENQGKRESKLQESGGEKTPRQQQNTTNPATLSSCGKFDPDSLLRTVRSSQPGGEINTEVPETPWSADPVKTADTEARWTVIGVTQLPALPPTSTLTASATGTAIAEMTGREGTSCMTTACNDQPRLSPFSIAAVKKKTDLNSSTLTSTPVTGDKSSNSVLPNSLSQPVGQGDIPVVSGSDDMKWTVVGMVSAAASASSAMNSALFSSPALTSSPVSLTSSPVSLGKLDSLTSNQLISLLPSLSGASLSSVLPVCSLPPMLAPEGPDKIQTHQGGIQSLITQSLGPQDLASQILPTKPSPNKQELCQPEHSEPQWKIVGLTQLGLSANSIVPLMPINHLTPVLPMPLLLPSAASPFMAGLPSELASFMLSSSGVSSVSSLVSSFSSTPSLFNTPMSSMPVLSLPSTSLLTPPPHSKLLNLSTSPGQLLTLPSLVQQQNVGRLLQDQLAVCRGSSNMLHPSEGNQWNVVGIIPNNQVTSSSSLSKQTPSPLTSTEDSITQVLPDTSTFSLRPKRYPLTGLGRRKTRGPTVNRSITIRQSLASRRESLDNKRMRFKCKDTMKKCHQQSARVKKNTVSSLLKIRRIQQGTSDNESSDGGQGLETLQQSLSDRVCEIPRKKAKIRSLRSYAGNRKIFTRTQNKTLGVRLSLRSGTQLATSSESLSYETRLLDDLPGSSTECQVAAGSPAGLEEDNLRTVTKMEAHSSSRRRKLKVPRKLIADVDYHPFDSSSDSN